MKNFITILLFCFLISIIGIAQNPTGRCKATTSKGTPCLMLPKKGKDYCRMHDPNRPICTYVAPSGKKCKNVCDKGKKLCWRHDPAYVKKPNGVY